MGKPPAAIPVYEYRIDLKPVNDVPQPPRTVRAIQYGIEGQWFVFDDATTTVLSIRQDLVSAIERGEQVAEQPTDVIG